MALCQPDLDLDAAGVALLLESLVRVVEKVSQPASHTLVSEPVSQLVS